MTLLLTPRAALLILCVLAATTAIAAPPFRGWHSTGTKSADDPLATLKPGHPRLLVGEDDWKQLRDRAQPDPVLAKVIARIEADARSLRSDPPLTYKKEGRRLLDVSRQAVERILLWAVTYHLTGDAAYAERARVELLNLAAFRDWNPSHFLDTAEMTTALALGYDWLYDQLDPAARDAIRRAIVDKGIRPGLDPAANYNSWHRSANNWNQVCFGGLTLGALAIGDEDPEPARALLRLARTGIAAGLRPYAPDGVYPEGPGYWEYGTSYQVLMLGALQSALGTQWGLETSLGFVASAAAQLQVTGPSGNPFNYFDSEERTDLQPPMFWFARRLQRPDLLRFQRRPLADALGRCVEFERAYHENRLFALIALWWTAPADPDLPPKLPLVWHGDGPNPVGVFRTSWTDTNAVFLAFKGGAANLSHGHMDAGSFVLEADGVRWAIDLGRQDYLSLESKGIDLWNYGQDSARWRVFRLNNFSHNTLSLDHQLHRADGAARITRFHGGSRPAATVDLSPVFAGLAGRVVRQFRLDPDRSVIIRDELSGLAPGTKVRWAMVTHAEVETAGDHAMLSQNGKSLRAILQSNPVAHFTVIAADPPNDGYDASNPNTRILLVHATAPPSGRIRLEVRLQPGAP